jgi:ATPase subunit of ABC transporter with duplicated ATPase domains
MEIADPAWNLPESVFDRSWSTLSAGEIQRAHLAIALALEPDILVLDEISSALDDDTTLLVEKTLTSWTIPILMVTHDRAQLNRFCTHHIEMKARAAPGGSLDQSAAP